MEGDTLFPTEEGTPQGGIISPLLANIALHGLETWIRSIFGEPNARDGFYPPVVIRYADDFVILHKSEIIIRTCLQAIPKWLKKVGLELKPEKTRITHTLNETEVNGVVNKPGFDFLGFNIRQYPVGKYNSGKNPQKQLLGFKTLIKPSKEAVLTQHAKLREIIKRMGKGSRQSDLIKELNPVIRGWSRYYSRASSKETFSKLDMTLHWMLWRWARRRHPGKSKDWVYHRSYQDHPRKWTFKDIDSDQLALYAEMEIIRRTKVQDARSPFDGDWVYWCKRLQHYPGVSESVATLMKKQQGKCSYCGQYFKFGDKLEKDHIIPTSKGGPRWGYDNLQLLHNHCHDSKTAADVKRYK
jgi:RNA-directed DNA polymerase